MGNETYSLIKHHANTAITVEPSTISGKRIGVLDSAMVNTLDAWLAAKGISAEVIRFSDYSELFDAFDRSAIDILAAEGDGAYGREHAEVLCAFGASEYYLCVNIRRPDLLSALNTAQAQLAVEEPNYLNSLKSKYYSVSVSSRAFSAAEIRWLEEHDTLKIGYLNNYLPYCGRDSSGEATGVIRDVVSQMLEELDIRNITVSYSCFDSYDRMIEALSSGETDMAFRDSPAGYYDAILMDVRMPEMDGLEATAAIRALDKPDAKTIPIIAMTANAFDENVQRSLQVGMNAHLSKPVEPDHLYQTLEELIWEAENKE